nr:ATP-binding protein [Armatimonadota bacterium]
MQTSRRTDRDDKSTPISGLVTPGGPEQVTPIRLIVLARDAGLVAGGHQFMTRLMDRELVPESVQFDILLVVGEALSNAEKYGDVRGKDVLLQARVRCKEDLEAPSGTRGVITMLFTYRTGWFNDNPPDPPLLEEHGRGIRLIRFLSEDGGGKAEWKFRPGQPASVVTVVTVKS